MSRGLIVYPVGPDGLRRDLTPYRALLTLLDEQDGRLGRELKAALAWDREQWMYRIGSARREGWIRLEGRTHAARYWITDEGRSLLSREDPEPVRWVDMLEALDVEPPPSLRDVSRRLGLRYTSTHRLAMECVEHGLIRPITHAERPGKYVLTEDGMREARLWNAV